MSEIITMISCPYCEEEFIREDTELVCNKCKPALNVDLAVAQVANGIEHLEAEAPIEVKTRVDLLVSLHSKLGLLIKKVQIEK